MRPLLPLLLAVCLLVAACGGDEPDRDAAAPTEEVAATAAPADDQTPTEVASHQPAGDGLPPDLDGQAGGGDAGGNGGGGDGDDGVAGGADAAGGGADPGGPGEDSEERELSDADQGVGIIGDPGDDAVSGGQTGGEVALLTDVRVGEHEGFDRIVLEFQGDAVPGYEVAFVDPPIRAAGSGAEVDIEGDTFLQISLSPAAGVDLSGEQPVQTYDGPSRIDGDSTRTVTEVVRTGDFEGRLTWVAGLSQQMPFAVSTLSGPARLVVDVQSL